MASKSTKVRFVCISDTHNKAPGEGYNLPKGDVLVHAGDLTNQGSYYELEKAVTWLQKADFAVKIVIAGNHDLSLDRNIDHLDPDKAKSCRELMSSIPGVTYLENSSTQIHLPDKDVSFRVFGSPCSALYEGKFVAFQYAENDAPNQWQSMTNDTDVLITHTAPAGICDASKHWTEGGCPALTKALGTVRPALHICGHCHEGRGAQIVRWSDDRDIDSTRVWEDPGRGNKKQSLLDLTGAKGTGKLDRGRETAVVNASIMMRSWETGSRTFNKPIVVDVVF